MSQPAIADRPSHRFLTGLAATVIVVAGLRAAEPVLAPIAFALFLALLSQPLFGGLRARGLPTGLAVLVTITALGIVVAIFVLLLLGSLGEFREVGPHYYASLQERFAYTIEWWEGKGIAILDWIPPKWQRPEAIAGVAGGTVKGAVTLLSASTVVFLTLVFLLFEAAQVSGKLGRLPESIRERIERFAHVSAELQRYLLIKTAMSAVIGVTAGLWVAFLGVDFPVLCGLIAFACHFIPNVGAILAGLPPVLFAFVQYDPAKSLYVAIGYIVLGTLLGNLLEPALMGRRLGLSPLVVFVSLVAWGWLWGPVGMFLSVPLTMSLKILLQSSEELRWVAILLGGGGAAVAGPPARSQAESIAAEPPAEEATGS